MLYTALLSSFALLPLLYSTASADTACNNSPSLCSKNYNNITHLGAHDSPFLRDKSTDFSESGNQYFNSTVQLDAGVRLLTAQVHKANSTSGDAEWHLCHTSCSLLDSGTLESWLSSIKSWLDTNKNDVVTILLVNSDDAAASDLGPSFKDSGISDYAYTPPSSSAAPTSWPTLENLISNNTRLITFVASLTPDTAYPYLMDEFTFVFESAFENTSPANFSSCQPNRPSSVANQPSEAIDSGRMFLMNHFLDSSELFGIETPNEDAVNVTNAATGTGSLGAQMEVCDKLYGREPTFVLVDFFNVGPAIASVDAANGVTDAVGRTAVTTAKVEDTGNWGVRAGGKGSVGAVVVAMVVAVWFGGL
ncbi:uncharacterized protein BDZ99DRAFT_468236 [Mytilinidion resinicola]|uniref:PLC-like phosphodiesterase n=1 Tax=Mytilinidion resinicola TaxID=574789 RepID=A0A6A6Y3M6_9PEZI|nr:uncharacterized protein BDZ99DRAFT_468236 [Mytilinidion resinicola]KAF2803260.1 hypothetical protein BDZ99DRAFT_468236 [Mytilinidion resinicola]